MNWTSCCMMADSTVSPTPRELLEEYLQPALDAKPPPRVTLEDFMTASERFPMSYPSQTARACTLVKNGYSKEELEEHINSSYPVIHEKLLPLLAAFLHYKKLYGRRKEKEVYAQLSLLDLVDRLLKKRPVVFFNPHDHYLLRDGTEGSGGFDSIGHSHEENKLTLEEYMSYDEVKLAALVSVSSYSAFVNDGSRHNRGVKGQDGTYERQGVIVGMVGARFEREGVMEWQDCVVTPDQNTVERGYGDKPPSKRWLVREWGRLWGDSPLPTYSETQKEEEHFFQIGTKTLFNKRVYKARIRIGAEVLLAEAGARARAAGKKAYVHVVGLGLGVWQLSAQQNYLFVEAWGDALAAADTSHVSHIDFSWISGPTSCHSTEDGQVFPGTQVTIHFSKRPLHALTPPDTLLVASYAWDGNSMPGNEYWKGMLSASGDPAAACSSGVAELHNAHVNPLVTSTNLHVVTSSGLKHIAAYAREILGVSDS